MGSITPFLNCIILFSSYLQRMLYKGLWGLATVRMVQFSFRKGIVFDVTIVHAVVGLVHQTNENQ